MTREELELFRQLQTLATETHERLNIALQALEEQIEENESLKKRLAGLKDASIKNMRDVITATPKTIAFFNAKLFEGIIELLKGVCANEHRAALLKIYNSGHEKSFYRDFRELQEAKSPFVQYKLNRVMQAYMNNKIEELQQNRR